MSDSATAPPPARDPRFFELKQQLEDFLFNEAELLDQRRFDEWLALLTDDLVYFMPLRRNVKFGQHEARENTALGRDISWFDEDKWTLAKRVEQIQTGIHWAEEPLSRVCHLIGNVQLLEVRPGLDSPRELLARSRFLVYQNRLESETNLFVGRRNDTLRVEGGQWKLARREILLEQSVLQAKSLTVFF
jgi:3-phenylpropionate/cinnamic acid dioxygenase small subunit